MLLLVSWAPLACATPPSRETVLVCATGEVVTSGDEALAAVQRHAAEILGALNQHASSLDIQVPEAYAKKQSHDVVAFHDLDILFKHAKTQPGLYGRERLAYGPNGVWESKVHIPTSSRLVATVYVPVVLKGSDYHMAESPLEGEVVVVRVEPDRQLLGLDVVAVPATNMVLFINEAGEIYY